MSTAQPPARTCCRTHGNVRSVHDNSNGHCEWVPVDAPTEQEWRILEEIRRRDGGQPDGPLSGVLATWADGNLRLLLQPAEPEKPTSQPDPAQHLSQAQLRDIALHVRRELTRQTIRNPQR